MRLNTWVLLKVCGPGSKSELSICCRTNLLVRINELKLFSFELHAQFEKACCYLWQLDKINSILEESVLLLLLSAIEPLEKKPKIAFVILSKINCISSWHQLWLISSKIIFYMSGKRRGWVLPIRKIPRSTRTNHLTWLGFVTSSFFSSLCD